jgi:hypothetical protein
MEPEVQKEKEEEFANTSNDWNNRVLCSDGNCIGVIGPDGCCQECGKKNEGDLPEMSSSEDEVQTEAEDADLASVATEIPEAEAAPVDDDWGNRVLCSDGNCIGVIGPDGKCKECGKPRE